MSAVVRLYLLRHGEPENTRMFYGHHDVDLSPRGREHVDQQVRALADCTFDEIHASDLRRARIGGDALAHARGLAPTYASALREMHLGCLEGVLYDDARERHPELVARSYLDMYDFRMPGGGESVRDTAERVRGYVEDLVVRGWAESESRTILLYVHNTVNRILLGLAAGCGAHGYGRFAQRYGAINRVDLLRPAAGRDLWSRATIVFANWDPRHPCP